MPFSTRPYRRFPVQETGTIPLGATQVIKVAAEGLTVLAVGSYAIGFIIVNSYLLTFGYSGNALIKTTYISAGILFLLLVTPLALLLYSFFLSRQWANDTTQDLSARRRRVNILSLGLLAFVAYYILNHIASNELRAYYEESAWWAPFISGAALVIFIGWLTLENINREWKLAVRAKKYAGLSTLFLYFTIFLTAFKIEVVFCLAFVVLAVFLGMQFFLNDRSILHRLRESPPDVALDLVIVIVLSLTAIGLFGTTLYGHIRPQYGGGQPTRVRVLIAEGKLTVLRLQGGLRNIDTLLSDTQLIDSSEKELLLLLKSSYDDKGLLFQVDRSIVDAVLYLPSSP